MGATSGPTSAPFNASALAGTGVALPGAPTGDALSPLADIANRTLSVKRFGAKGDGRTVTGVTVSNGATSCLVTSGVTSADTGRLIALPLLDGSGGWFSATLTYIDATHVTLGTAAPKAFTAAAGLIGANDTTAIDRAWTQSHAITNPYYYEYFGLNQAYEVAGTDLHFPPGTYLYKGAGLTFGDGTNILELGLRGEYGRTKIINLGTAYFLSGPQLNRCLIQDFEYRGGKGLFKQTSTAAMVREPFHFRRLHVADFTECGIAFLAQDAPTVVLDHCYIMPDELNGGAHGVCFAHDGYADGVRASGCWFMYYKYGAKLGRSGTAGLLDDCFFSGCQTSGGADLWVVPEPVGSNNYGEGLRIVGCKFGNELLAAGGLRVIYADEGAGADFASKPHATTESAGRVHGVQFSKCKIMGSASQATAFITSWTSWVAGTLFDDDNVFAGSLVPQILKFDAAVTTPAAYDKENIIKTPMLPDIGTAGGYTAPAAQRLLACNRPAAVRVFDPLYAFVGQQGVPPYHAAGASSVFHTSLADQDITGTLGGTASVARTTGQTDPYGGTKAALFVFSAANGYVAVSGWSAPAVGDLCWIHLGVKAAASNPLPWFQLWVIRDIASQFPEVVRAVTVPAAGWAELWIPWKLGATPASDIWLFLQPGGGFGAGATSVLVHRPRIYTGPYPVLAGGS